MRSVILSVGGALVLLFGWLVWPTPYRYEHLGPELLRVTRATGHVTVVYDLRAPSTALAPCDTTDPFNDLADVPCRH